MYREQIMSRAIWIRLGAFFLILVGVGWVLRAFGFDVTQFTPERVRDVVRSFGAWAPLIYLMVYGQPIIPLPASIMTIAGGLAFGPVWGMLAALGGATTRASSQFAVARLLGREAVAKLLKGGVAQLDQKIGERSFSAVLLIRLIPNFPFDMQNYGLGFSRVRFVPYALATFLGIMPASFAFVYLGYSLTNPKQIWKLLLAIVLILGLMKVTSVWKKRHPAPLETRA